MIPIDCTLLTFPYSCIVLPYYMIKLSVCPSVHHADNSPGTAHVNASTVHRQAVIICLFQVCNGKLIRCSVCTLQWEIFHQKNNTKIAQ